MSQVRKLIERPKVRFCSTAESIGTNYETSCAPKATVQRNKPQIKSIVTLKQPIRLMSKETAAPYSSGTSIENLPVCRSSESILKLESRNDSVPCSFETNTKCTSTTVRDTAFSRSSETVTTRTTSDVPNAANIHASYPSGIQTKGENYHTNRSADIQNAAVDYNAACSSGIVKTAGSSGAACLSDKENKVVNRNELKVSYPVHMTGNYDTAHLAKHENNNANHKVDCQDTNANYNISNEQNWSRQSNVQNSNSTSEKGTIKTQTDLHHAIATTDSRNTQDSNEVINLRNCMAIPQSKETGKNSTSDRTVSNNKLGPNVRSLGAIPKNIVPKVSAKAQKNSGASGSITGRTTSQIEPSTSGTIAKKNSTGTALKKQCKATLSQKKAVPKNIVTERTVRSASRSSPAKHKITAKVAPRSCRSLPSGKTLSLGTKSTRTGGKMISPMKKTVLRNIVSRPMMNAYVGPGVTRCKPDHFKEQMGEELPHIRPDIVSGEKLGRPEYNSIMCTINKLREVQDQKFVTDVEHLPMFYRNLVNGKISAALDFSPDEAIFKNLVDLSISENQLPSRLTRSKDPEPRQKDIVPKLSDFFKPSYSEEYCCAVRVRPQSPENVNNWSAFAISDKIFGWKHDMDHCH